MANLIPLVFAARLAKEGHGEEIVEAYLAYHWGIDLYGEELQ